MKGSWISPKVRERHIVCNLLLGVFFAPLIIIDLLLMFAFLAQMVVEWRVESVQFVISGILALLGVYGVLLRNKWNGFFLGLLALLSISAAYIAHDSYEMSFNESFDGMSKVQAIMDGLLSSCIITFIATLPILLILLIRKNGVSAIKLLEGGGIITKCGIEIIISILMCCITVVTSC